MLHALQSPSLERYSSVHAHVHGIRDMRPTLDGGLVSVSNSMLRLHTSGGLPLLTYTKDEVCYALLGFSHIPVRLSI